jgi:hypothetical protein
LQKTNTSVRIVANGIDVGENTRSRYWYSVKSSAEDIVNEITEYGASSDPDDLYDRVRQAADDTAWVIYYFRSRLVGFYCSPEAYDYAVDQLDEFLGEERGDLWNRANTLFAYFAYQYDVEKLVDEAMKK